MPIYAYRCSTCGYAKDVLQKMSDPVLSVCPECGNPTYQKQVTAAGFQESRASGIQLASREIRRLDIGELARLRSAFPRHWLAPAENGLAPGHDI